MSLVVSETFGSILSHQYNKKPSTVNKTTAVTVTSNRSLNKPLSCLFTQRSQVAHSAVFTFLLFFFKDYFSGFLLLFDRQCRDRKLGREKGYDKQHGSFVMELSHGYCGYVECVLTIRPTGHPYSLFINLLFVRYPQSLSHQFFL